MWKCGKYGNVGNEGSLFFVDLFAKIVNSQIIRNDGIFAPGLTIDY